MELSELKHSETFSSISRQALILAEKLVRKDGMQPFAFVMEADGNQTLVALFEQDVPDKELVIRNLLVTLAQQGKQATLLCYGASLDRPGNSAICFEFEHQDGESCFLAIPYKKGWFGRLKYPAEGFFEMRPPRVFTGASADSVS